MITPEELLELIGGEGYDAVQVEDLERAAVAFVETQTGRYFGPPELVEEFIRGNGSRNLWLRDHVTTVEGESGSGDDDALVTVGEWDYPGGTGTDLVQDVDFVLRQLAKESLLVRMANGAWTDGYEYAVTYWRGYQAGEEPADIRQLVLDLIRGRWAQRGAFGLKSETIEGYSYTRFDDRDLDAMGGWGTITLWRRPVLA